MQRVRTGWAGSKRCQDFANPVQSMRATVRDSAVRGSGVYSSCWPATDKTPFGAQHTRLHIFGRTKMEFGFLGVILGLVAVILVRVSYTARDIQEIKETLRKQGQATES